MMVRPGLTRAVAGAVLGGAVGAGGLLAAGAIGIKAEPGQILGLGYLFALFGFLLGIGAFRFWLTWATARPIDAEEEHAWHGTAGDWRRYFRFTTDHKVITSCTAPSPAATMMITGSPARPVPYPITTAPTATGSTRPENVSRLSLRVSRRTRSSKM